MRTGGLTEWKGKERGEKQQDGEGAEKSYGG